MPEINHPSTAGTMLGDLMARLSRIEHSPQIGSTTISNGALIITDAAGNSLIYLGQLPDATYGLAVYDPAGHQLLKLDATGLAQFDTAANPRTKLGLLPNNDYGLASYSRANDNTYTEILPAKSASVPGILSTNSASYVNLGGPSVTATVGATGNVLLTASSRIAITADNGWVGISIDGGAPSDLLVAGIGTGNILEATALTEIITGLSAGNHTFQMWYRVSGTATANFSANNLVVTPI